MNYTDKPSRPYVVLIASEEDWSVRSLESVLEPNGYAVVRARSGHEAIELAYSAQPDAVILGLQTAGLPGIEVCRSLRGDPRFPATTPVMLTSTHGVSRSERLDAYGAGAWELCSHPLDVAALLLKLQTFIRAKQVSDRLRDSGLVDELTGFYNIHGMTRRARELGAEAARRGAPLTCAAVGAFLVGSDGREVAELHGRMVSHVAATVRFNARTSDVLGRLGQGDFLVIAPSTDASGATQLLARFQRLLEQTALPDDFGSSKLNVRTAFVASSNAAEADTDGVEMLMLAANRLRTSSPGIFPTNGATQATATAD